MAKDNDSLPLLKFRSSKDIHEPQGTFWTSVFALVGTMMGAGALSLPSTMAQANVVPDIILFVVMACINFVACNACVTASEYTGKHSFESMASLLFGSTRQWFVRVLTVVLLFGIQAVFFVVSLDLLHPFVAQYLTRFFLGVGLTIIVIPLCLLETMYALRYTNAIVVGCMIYIFLVVGIRATSVGGWPENVTDVTTTSAKGLMYALPIQALSYGCQINSMRIYGELQNKSQMTAVNGWTMALGCVLYVAFSILGFICFRGFPPADILTGFPTDDLLVNSVRLVLGSSVILKIPLIFQPFMQVLEAVCLSKEVIENDPKPFRYAATVTSVVAAFLLAVTFKDLSVVMGFVGATGDLCINFAVPGLFLLEVGRRTNSNGTRWLGIFLFIAGIAMAILSLIGLLA